METVEWIIDPGHGWLRVPVETCEGLRVSEYSYIDRRAGVIFLEEDCDAGLWLRAHGANASDYRVTFLDDDAPCRMLPRVRVSVAS